MCTCIGTVQAITPDHLDVLESDQGTTHQRRLDEYPQPPLTPPCAPSTSEGPFLLPGRRIGASNPIPVVLRTLVCMCGLEPAIACGQPLASGTPERVDDGDRSQGSEG